MKYSIFIISFFWVGLATAWGQQGTQRLRLAQSVYEQGKLRELPGILNARDVSKMTKQDQASAYKLLILAHTYLEEPERADSSMLQLLRADNFYEPNETLDPAEFVGLYKTFRTKPVFNIGLRFGANSTIPLISKNYYVAGGPGGDKYSAPISLQFGLAFEKHVFDGLKSKFFKRMTFAPELMYTSRNAGISNSNYLDGQATYKATLIPVTLDLNLLFNLKLNKSKQLQTYIAFGPGVNYLLKATLSSPTLTWKGGQGGNNGSDVSVASAYKKIVPSVIGGIGAKYKFGAIYLIGEARVQYGLVSPIDPAHRTVREATYDYATTIPDYKPVSIMVNIGFNYPYFNPIKLKRK